MSYRMSRRFLVSRASALGAGVALSGTVGANAQSTAGASPTDLEVSPAEEAVIQEIQEMGGSLRILSAVVGG